MEILSRRSLVDQERNVTKVIILSLYCNIPIMDYINQECAHAMCNSFYWGPLLEGESNMALIPTRCAAAHTASFLQS